MSISYNLERFHCAQESSYPTALAEIRAGRKSSHWMWYIFPQMKGLGYSSMAAYYGIDGLEEAKVYLNDPVLRSRLVEISSALLKLPGSDAGAVMGYPDNLKLRSSMTLFTWPQRQRTRLCSSLCWTSISREKWISRR